MKPVPWNAGARSIVGQATVGVLTEHARFGRVPPACLRKVNGLRLYYETHGKGGHLVLLHGAFLTIDLNFGALLPTLAQNHQVIAIELQGHGQ